VKQTDDPAATGRFRSASAYESLVGFRDAYPAATMVVVKGLLDPRWRVEIEAEAELLG